MIVGSQTQWVRGVHPDIDFGLPWEIRKTIDGDLSVVSERIRGVISEEDRRSILEDCQFWEGQSTVALAEATLRELWGDKWDIFNEVKVNTEFVNSPSAKTGDFGEY